MRNVTKLAVLISTLVFAVIITACGGNATSNSGSTGSSSNSGGDPAAAVKGFFNAAFTGGDVNSYLCKANEASAKAISQGMDSMKSALAASGAKISTEKLTFDVASQNGDTAQVKVAGKLTTTVSGTSTDSDYPGATITLKNEGGAWKICG